MTPTSPISAFSHPIFRSVWIATLLSNLGGLIQSVAASWLMLSIAPTADMVALVQASVALPILLLSLVAGAVADNLDRRRVMLAAQVFMLLISASLALTVWLGLISPWLLLMFTFLIGCGAAFNAPAWQASVGDMVPRAQLAAAVTMNSMGFNIARSVGPAIGGLIVAGVGLASAFAVNALSYVALIIVLLRWQPKVEVQALPRESMLTAIAAGLRYVWMSPAIRTVLLRGAVFGFCASALMALNPLVAKVLIQGGPLAFGALLGAFGVGAVGGAFSSSYLRSRLSTEALVRGACSVFACAVAVVAFSTSLALTMVALLLCGASWVLALSTFNVAVQLSAPRWVVARAISLYQMAAFGGIAAGSWWWGWISAQYGVSHALAGAAVSMLGCALLGFWRPLAQSEEVNLDPLRNWAAPQTAVEVEMRTGPVVVTIEYRIDVADMLDFLSAMSDRRRIRRRDGALHWRLLRDLADPELWIERYETPTWLEYLRHNNRITHDDAYIPQRLRALHRGPDDPRVKRMIERQTSALPSGALRGSRDLAEPLTDPTLST